MSIAVKSIILLFIFGTLGVVFQQNILMIVGAPLATIQDFVGDVALLVNNLCSLSDAFLVTGTMLTIFKAVTLFVFFYIQFMIFYPLVKLIAY